jgi:serine/threonine protein kinase
MAMGEKYMETNAPSMNPESLCMGCMSEKGDAPVCSVCEWQEGTLPDSSSQLPPRTLVADKYLLGRVLGQGGFGITYLAWDLILGRKLAIKEYFPRELCSRARDDRTVQPLNTRSREDFGYGLSKFVEEGRALARFRDYPGIVALLDFFEANGTAYIVMDYMDGMTMKQYLESQGGRIAFDLAVEILIPVMDALREVHRVGMLHRDISPDNIYINSDRQIKILDFGSTRYAMREQSQHLTVLFKPGYAPLEQYSSGGKQGPWTDVYAVGATFYRALTGKSPSEAPDRLAQDDLLPPSRLGAKLPPASETALMKALAVHWEKRFQNIADFQESVVPRPVPVKPVPTVPSPPQSLNIPLLIAACVLLATTLTFAGLWRSSLRVVKPAQIIQPGADLKGELSAMQNDNANLTQQVAALTAERDALQAKLTGLSSNLSSSKAAGGSLRQENDSLKIIAASLSQQLDAERAARKNETDSLKSEITYLKQQIGDLQTSSRQLQVVYFELYNWDNKHQKRIGAASVRFQTNALHYLLCAIGGPNASSGKQALSRSVEVRIIDPNQAVRNKAALSINAAKSDSLWSTQTAWGNDKAGTFQPLGDWRVEIWSDGQKVAGKQFQVY